MSCVLCHLSNRSDESSLSYQFEWNIPLMMMTPTVICRVHSHRTLCFLFDCSNNWKKNFIFFITIVICFLCQENISFFYFAPSSLDLIIVAARVSVEKLFRCWLLARCQQNEKLSSLNISTSSFVCSTEILMIFPVEQIIWIIWYSCRRFKKLLKWY